MRELYFFAIAVFAAWGAQAQTFTNSNNLLPDSYNSGGCLGVSDMDNDGMDDIILLDNSNNLKVLYQQMDGFNEVAYGQVSGANQWGMAIGDCDNDGHSDVFCGGSYDGVHHVKISDIGTSDQITMADQGIFMQACNMADIDNDGLLDAFACHDDATSRIYMNDGTDLVFDMEIIDLESYDFTDYPTTDHSGNYGSVWTDFDRDGDVDLFIAKCRQFVGDPNDPRRINQLWVNGGDGTWTEEALERGLVVYEQSWTTDFADYDNDGDWDCLLTNHSGTMMMLANDGNGYFSDVTAETGLAVPGFFLQAKMADFDNDGFVDLVYSGGIHSYHRNNGDGTFTEVPNVFPNGDTMHSLSIGDLNQDGWLDLYASYGDVYVSPDNQNEDILWLNDGGTNNWVSFDLEGIQSNTNAVGATVEISGSFGTQLREVRAGESYGINNTFHCHFGLGTAEAVEQVVVYWPSGITTVIDDPEINVVHNVSEAECQISGVEITANGDVTICPGETVELTAPEGYTYNWIGGGDTQSITVSESGSYSVVVFDDNSCVGVSNSIAVDVLESTAPSITVNGDLLFCEGESVELIASNGEAHDWGNGLETQVLTVETSGDYQVSVTDVCDVTLASEMVTVEVIDGPMDPMVENQTISTETTVLLEGNVPTLLWYENENDTDPIFEGQDFETPLISTSTTYYVENVSTGGGDEFTGGRFDNSGSGAHHNNSNRWQLFDAYEPMTIVSVVMYASGEFDRTIELLNNNGTVLETLTTTLVDGENVVELNFDVEAGTDYALRLTDANPQVWRTDNEAMVDYPYALGNLGAITQSTASGANAFAYYYFFYNWTVKSEEVECVSDRFPVNITFSNINEIEGLNDLNVYPNPASEILNVNIDLLQANDVQLELLDLAGRVVSSEQFRANSGSNVKQMDLQVVSAGVYHLRATINGQIATQKVIVR